jgi:membrane protein implicated in regulation of membrane protease activity
MRPLGTILMIGGALVGASVALAMMGVFHLAIPWLVAVGLAKLTLLGSAGLMAAGAVCHRLALRQEQRDRLLTAHADDRRA